MANTEGPRKFFDALNESSDALIDGVRAANERGHRVSAALIEQAQEGQRESVELAKKWAAAPFDVAGFYGSIIESTTKTQGRVLEAMRQWFNEMGEAQKESREIFQRLVTANRSAGEATVDVARGLFEQAGEAVQSARPGNGRKESSRQESSKAPAGRAGDSTGETRSSSTSSGA